MIDQPVTWHDIERELETYVYPAQDQDVLIFGGGLQGINAAPELAKELSIVAFCDNDWQKQGTTISDLPCIAPSEISRFENPFILVSTIILSARKIYSRGCTSKKIGAIIKEKGGGG